MNNFSHIDKIIIPSICVAEVYLHLRQCGADRLEGVALWAGTSLDHVFEVSKTIIPKQNGYRTEDGLLYTVDADELHAINKWLYRHGLIAIAQVHSHPSEAYHSETDDQYPIISQIGGVSIVIPDFGFGRPSLKAWAAYRLSGVNGWSELSPSNINSLITISN